MMEICQGHCVCNGNTNMAYKSQRDVTSACVRADGVDGYCLVLLLGNGRVTLWCNRGYEHICHSPSLYLKEKRGHWSLWGWGGGGGRLGDGSRLTVDPQLSSQLTLLQLPYATVSGGAMILFHSVQWQT